MQASRDDWGENQSRPPRPTYSISLAPPTPLLTSDMSLDDQMVTFQTMRSLDSHRQQPAQSRPTAPSPPPRPPPSASILSAASSYATTHLDRHSGPFHSISHARRSSEASHLPLRDSAPGARAAIARGPVSEIAYRAYTAIFEYRQALEPHCK